MPMILVAVWLLCAASVGISLLAIHSVAAAWAARPAGHWFFRAVALVLFCSAWLLIPDYQLWLFFVTFSFGMLLTLRCLSWHTNEGQQAPIANATTESRFKLPRFSLADLLLSVVIVGIVLAIFMRAPLDAQSHWHLSVLPGTVLAVVFAVAAWADSRRTDRRRWKRAWCWIVLAFLPIAWAVWPIPVLPKLIARARERRLHGAAALGAALCAAPGVVFFGWAVWPRFVSPPAAPSDNGYDDFMAAGALLLDDPADIVALTGEPLRDYVVRHQESLALGRAALKRPCRVPWPDGQKDPKSLDGLRQVARLFVAEGRDRAAEGNFADAIESDLDAMRIGQAIVSGGLLLDHLVGGAYELSGLDGLRPLIGRLDDGDCVRLSESLTALLTADRESFDDVASRERRHNDLTRPWTERLVLLQFGKLWDEERQVFENQTNRILCSGRLLLTHTALRRFRVANAVYPASLDELVPHYLDAAPIDSFSGKSLIYRKREDGYQLYSVGPDGKDDNGTSMTGTAPATPGDLLFDVGFEPD